MEDKSKFTTVVQKNGAVVIGPNAVGVKGDLSDEDLGKISQIRRSTSSNLQEDGYHTTVADEYHTTVADNGFAVIGHSPVLVCNGKRSKTDDNAKNGSKRGGKEVEKEGNGLHNINPESDREEVIERTDVKPFQEGEEVIPSSDVSREETEEKNGLDVNEHDNSQAEAGSQEVIERTEAKPIQESEENPSTSISDSYSSTNGEMSTSERAMAWIGGGITVAVGLGLLASYIAIKK